MKWDAIRTQSKLIQDNKGKSQPGPHCAIGRIDYDNGGEGVLIYVKSSMTGDENDYVRDYNRRNKDFPHETTADQFFSEEQFEVYRALGFHAMDGVLGGNHLVQTTAGLESLRSGSAKGYGLKLVRQMLGLSALPASGLPKPPKP